MENVWVVTVIKYPDPGEPKMDDELFIFKDSEEAYKKFCKLVFFEYMNNYVSFEEYMNVLHTKHHFRMEHGWLTREILVKKHEIN